MTFDSNNNNLIAAIVQALLKDDDFLAELAKFVEGEIIATLEVTDIVGEDRVAKIESRIKELEATIGMGGT